MALFGFMTTILSWFGGLALLVVLVLVVLRVFNKNAVGAWWHLGRTKAGQAGDYATSIDPAGQMRQAAKDGFEELKKTDKAAEANEKLKLKLEDQLKEERKTLAKLEGQVATKLKEGVSESDPVIVEKLKRIQDLEVSISANEDQVEELTAQYELIMKDAKKAGTNLAAAMKEADRLGVQLEVAGQIAGMREMMAKYDPSAVNSKLSDIGKFREAARDKLRGHAAAAKVARDRAPDSDGDDDDNVTPETDAELGDVLARLKAKKGLGDLPATSTK